MVNVFWKNQSSYFCFTPDDGGLSGKNLRHDNAFYQPQLLKAILGDFALLVSGLLKILNCLLDC